MSTLNGVSERLKAISLALDRKARGLKPVHVEALFAGLKAHASTETASCLQEPVGRLLDFTWAYAPNALDPLEAESLQGLKPDRRARLTGGLEAPPS